MNKSLSGQEMLKAVSGKAKVMTYPDLTKYNDLDKALGKHKAIFLLYPYKDEPHVYGHWTLIMKNGKTVDFFDSYNYKPDDELKFAKNEYRETHNMELPHLTKLLLKEVNKGNKVDYSNYKLQSKDNQITTCGRHCIVRLILRHLTNDEYYKLMKNIKNDSGLNFDEIVYDLTKEI